MNQVPIVHATELLAHTFGIVAASVKRRLPADDRSTARFEVTDVAGRQWWLESVLLRSQRAMRYQQDPPRSAIRWGRYWVLTEAIAGEDDGTARHGRRRAGAAPDCTQPGWDCADGRALERVGSWLAQPAGLPAATDILGQCFVETWLRNRVHIAAMHTHAEAMHDALARHASPAGQAVAGALPAGAGNEAYRHQRVLRHLVESQHLLLGCQARGYPVAVRRDALRRLNALLDAERARGAIAGTLWRAG